MFRNTIIGMLFLITAAMMAGCDGGSDGDRSSTSVYIFGNDKADGIKYAGYWKNGVRHNVSQGNTQLNITVQAGSSFYSSGSESNTSGELNRACYWTNDSVTYLEDAPTNNATRSYSSSVRLYGGQIYVSGSYGYSPSYACYWLDGERIDLETATISFANDIFVDDDDEDVYVFGTYWNSGYHPCYWKNGTREDLPSSLTGNYLRGYTQDGDILYIPYLAGYFTFDITDDSSEYIPVTGAHMLNRIKIFSGHVYAAGTKSDSGDRACLWIDGTELFAETAGSEAFDVALDGAAVYMCGNDIDADVACYWKDGVRYPLTSETGTSAHNIFILK